MTTVSISEASSNVSHWINKASYGDEYVILTSRGRPKAVLIGMEAFERLLGLHLVNEDELLPLDELQRGFRAALAEAGYHSREDILALVQEVKREMADEYEATA